MTVFDKRAHNIDEQLTTLRQRGLAIPDDVRARHYLGPVRDARPAYW